MLEKDKLTHNQGRELAELVFYDRGTPYVISYLKLMKLPVPAQMPRAVQKSVYNTLVFIAPLWAEIYCQDNERRQSFFNAKKVYMRLADTYNALGYKLIHLPLTSSNERINFILDHINKPD